MGWPPTLTPLPRRLRGPGVVVDVGFPPMLLVHVPVGNVYVLECGMIVFVAVGGQQMAPVLSLMQIVRDVIMLVSVLQGFVLVMTLRTRHRAHPLLFGPPQERGADRTPGNATPQADPLATTQVTSGSGKQTWKSRRVSIG